MSPCQHSSALSPCCSLTLSPTPTRRAAQEEAQCSPFSGRDRDSHLPLSLPGWHQRLAGLKLQQDGGAQIRGPE